MASGRGTNAQSIIDHIEAGTLSAEIVVIISDREDARVLKRAGKHGIEALYLPIEWRERADYDRLICRNLRERAVDLVVLAGFMRILSPYFIREYAHRIINIHPSLLPAFPGLAVQRQALEHGVKITGCTVHFADEGLDSGPIILQAAVPVLENDTEKTLSARILEQEHKIFPQAIQLIAEDRVSIKNGRTYIRGD